MKVLILSCTMGQGHNAAARAVYDEFLRRGVPCELADALSFAGERVSRGVAAAYFSIAHRTPRVFQAFYRAGDIIRSPLRKSPVYLANALYRNALLGHIESNRFDHVVTTHLFPAQTLTVLKSRGLTARTYAVSTDYTCIPFWEETALDWMTVAHPDLMDEYVARGIPVERLLPLGIPVSAEFRERVPRAEARARLGLPPAPRSVLLMPNLKGFSTMSELIDALDAQYGANLAQSVLTGTDERLCAQMREHCEGRDHIRVVPFTREVSLYMDASDLVFTKPGGLTSTEAAVKNLPMVLTAPIPGCETRNAAFFEQRGAAVVAHTLTEQLIYARRMLNDRDGRERMMAAQRAHIPSDAAGALCDHILSEG